MKKVLSLLTGVIMIGNLFSQDIITLKSGEEIKAKVLEVGTSEIKYKKFDNMDGPSYTVIKSNVFMIKYANGSKDVFKTETESSSIALPTQTTSELSPSQVIARKKEAEALEKAKQEKEKQEKMQQIEDQISDLERARHKSKVIGGVFLGLGIPFLAGGATMLGIGADEVNNPSTHYSYNYATGTYESDGYDQSGIDEGNSLIAAGAVLLGVGVAWTLIIPPIEFSTAKRIKRKIGDLESQQYSFNPMLGPSYDKYTHAMGVNAGIGFKMTF
jgi:hypothetical protein